MTLFSIPLIFLIAVLVARAWIIEMNAHDLFRSQRPGQSWGWPWENHRKGWREEAKQARKENDDPS